LLDNSPASAANSRPKHDNAGDPGARVRRDKRWLSARRRWTRSCRRPTHALLACA